jgi:hypothetical protein
MPALICGWASAAVRTSIERPVDRLDRSSLMERFAHAGGGAPETPQKGTSVQSVQEAPSRRGRIPAGSCARGWPRCAARLVEWLMRDGIAGGTLALLAGVNAAIDAFEATAEAPADIVGTGHAVLSDEGGEIRLTVYREAAAVAAVLPPRRAVALAGELIAAALPRLREP